MGNPLDPPSLSVETTHRHSDLFYLFVFSTVVWNRSIGQGRKEWRSRYLLHWRWHSIFAEHSECHDSFRLWGTFLDYGLDQKEVEEAQATKRIDLNKTKRWEGMRNSLELHFSTRLPNFYFFPFISLAIDLLYLNFEAVMARTWVMRCTIWEWLGQCTWWGLSAFLSWE